MKTSILSGHALLSLIALCSSTAFGMEALREKQLLVAQEEPRKNTQTKDQAESSKPAPTKKTAVCSMTPKELVSIGIPVATPAQWVANTAQYADFYRLFGIDAKNDNKALSAEKNIKLTQEIFNKWMALFKTQQENACEKKEDIDLAIIKITAFKDFIVDIRATQMDGKSLQIQMLNYQEAYFQATTAIEKAKYEQYKSENEAKLAQQDYTFRAALIKEHAKGLVALDVNTKKFIQSFDITDRSTGVAVNLNIDVKNLMAEVGTVQGAIAKDTRENNLNDNAKKGYSDKLNQLKSRIATQKKQHSEEDDLALSVLETTIEKERTKLGIK